MFGRPKDDPENMLDDYNRGVTRTKKNTTFGASPQPRGAMCLCVQAKWVLVASSFTSFVLGLTVLVLGTILHSELDLSETGGWDSLIICTIVVGALVMVFSFVGLLAARSELRPVITFYFVMTAALGGLLFGGALYLWLESSRIANNWEEVQTFFRTDVTRAEAEAIVTERMVAVGVTFALLLASIMCGLGASARMAGTGYTFVGVQIITLFLGVSSIVGGWFATDRVLPIVFMLLYASGSALAIAAVAGSCGAHRLSRECLGTCFSVLFACVIMYFWLVGTAYPELVARDAHAAEWSIVLGMGLVSGYWSVLSLVLGGVYYCESRTAIAVRASADADVARVLH